MWDVAVVDQLISSRFFARSNLSRRASLFHIGSDPLPTSSVTSALSWRLPKTCCAGTSVIDLGSHHVSDLIPSTGSPHTTPPLRPAIRDTIRSTCIRYSSFYHAQPGASDKRKGFDNLLTVDQSGRSEEIRWLWLLPRCPTCRGGTQPLVRLMHPLFVRRTIPRRIRSCPP